MRINVCSHANLCSCLSFCKKKSKVSLGLLRGLPFLIQKYLPTISIFICVFEVTRLYVNLNSCSYTFFGQHFSVVVLSFINMFPKFFFFHFYFLNVKLKKCAIHLNKLLVAFFILKSCFLFLFSPTCGFGRMSV